MHSHTSLAIEHGRVDPPALPRQSTPTAVGLVVRAGTMGTAIIVGLLSSTLIVVEVVAALPGLVAATVLLTVGLLPMAAAPALVCRAVIGLQALRVRNAAPGTGSVHPPPPC